MQHQSGSMNYAIAMTNHKFAMYALEDGTIKDYCEHMIMYREYIVKYRNENNV